MNKRFADIARRKQALIERCAQERAEFDAAYRRIRSPIELGGVITGLSRTLQSHPLIAAGVSSLLASGYAPRLIKSVGEGVILWKFILPIWDWWKSRKTRR